MSLSIDMKLIFLIKFSGVSFYLNSNSWISWLSCNVLNPGKIFHSNSIGSPSILSKVLYSGELLNHVNLSSHAIFDWGFSCISRTRSFTLCKNDRDLRERFDSVTVSECISISMTNLLDTGLTVLVPDISTDFRTWDDHLSSLFYSEEFDELARKTGLPVPVCCTLNELRGTFWLSDLVFPGFSDAVETSTFGSLTRHRETKFITGFDFAVTLSSPASSCVLSDITSRRLMELKWLMLYKHKRWSHSSRVKCSLCQYVGELVFGVNVLIWIYGSKLILSNNQSRATLWVLEICLIAGLLPFMIILITASLSSKMYNKSSLREEFAFENQHYSDHQSFQEFSFALEMWTGLPVLVYSDSYFREEQ